MTTYTTTVDAIEDDKEIEILAKVENKVTFENGDEKYRVRDISANTFTLKLWASEADSYEFEVGQWYHFSKALGDTFDDPQIGSNHGDLEAEAKDSFSVDDIPIARPETSKEDIEDGEDIDIIARVDNRNEFEDGNVILGTTGVDGGQFDLKLWNEEASQYDLEIGQWYLFIAAEGDTFDEPMITSNSGNMIEVPVSDIS